VRRQIEKKFTQCADSARPMTKVHAANGEIFSQIETIEPTLRVVLLGASNLSIRFPTIVETARAMFAQPLEMIVAKGFGRSYGQQSKFFGKKFPGILQSGLWDVMNRARPLRTVAILADIGNDIAYEAPVKTIVRWVESTFDRLAMYDAQVVLNNLPLASISTVGSARYSVLREILFPGCRLPRGEMLRRAGHLSEALEQVAQERKTPIFSGEFAWYGIDPIHPRRKASGEIWRRMLGELASPGSMATLVRPTPINALRLQLLRPESWVQFGFARQASQPGARLDDGTTIALY
jgi:hypothetical protein